MTEAEFWKLIAMMPPRDVVDDLGAVADEADRVRLEAALAALPDAEVIGFFHLFSKKLHDLDTPAHHRNCVVGGQEASSDVFLYARCHVLSLGQARYRDVLAAPETFPPDLWFEDILYVANGAYDRVWERDADRAARPSYESFSNVAWRAE